GSRACCWTAPCMSLRKVASSPSVRATPTIAKCSGRRRRTASAYSAGMSFLWVRSPEAPKITSAQGSGVRRRASPSASGFSSCWAGAVSVTALFSLFRALLQMAAERLAHRGEDAVAPVGLAARGVAVEEGRREDGSGHAFLDGRLHRPASLAGVADVAGVVLEVG